MNLKAQPTILVIGKDATLSYLLGRFAEHSGYQLKVNGESISSSEIAAINPTVIIFLSTELLARNQTFLAGLASLDASVVVCSSVVEEARAIELGADYCLLHPFTYGDFQTILANAAEAKHA